MAETHRESSNTETAHYQEEQTNVAFTTATQTTDQLSTFSMPTLSPLPLSKSSACKTGLQIRTTATTTSSPQREQDTFKNTSDESIELMLARAEVANDLLFKDPKRVVIEGGSVNADEGTLRSLMDVTSPTSAKPADEPWLDETQEPLRTTGEPDSYPVYPEGDERALPGFIVGSQTVEELDAVTGAWEAALDTLGDGEFWRAVVSDSEGLKRRAPLHLAAKIRAGIPARVRGVVWQALTQARSTYLQTVYAQLVQEPSPHERVIRRDLPRTFPRIPVFKREGGDGQQRLFRVLKAYSLYDAEVGYCQGLGFIIGPLIMNMDECHAFCVLVRLMETYGLRGMFTEDMAGLHLRLYQFSALAHEIVPDVMEHLAVHGVLPAMYAPAWFLSLFAYTMPLSFVLRAIDVVVAEGAPESIVRIGVALLQRNASDILQQDDFESAMVVLSSGLYDDAARPRDRPGFVLQDAARLAAVVTAERLAELETQYYREQGTAPRPSVSSPAPQQMSSSPTANHAVIKFLGWPWARDHQKPVRDDVAVSSAAGGRLSPRALELTDAQRARSQRLREQMLRSLQTQDLAPATMLGSVAALTPLGDATRVSPSSSSSLSSMTASPDDVPARMSMAQRSSETSDNAWRDEVLEPLQRQLHDARVTCDSHRDALVALQADHEALRAELAMAKAEKAHLAEDNEQLCNMLRKLEAECSRNKRDAEDQMERSLRSEEALVQARMELAEADEEKALLVRQLGNLRRFIASEGNAAANASSPGRVSTDDCLLQDDVQPPVAQKQASRFSISSFASGWSAVRDAITSPRPSMQSEPIAASTAPMSPSPSSSLSGGPQLVVS
ncbi:hypothetical protein LPJ64_004513, partial [Coemansia asiatica]